MTRGSNDAVVLALCQQIKSMGDSLTAQNALLGQLLRKTMDAALLAGPEQITRVLGEQDTERAAARGEEMPPRPFATRPGATADDEPFLAINVPASGGGM